MNITLLLLPAFTLVALGAPTHAQSQSPSAPSPRGTIAYVRDNKEVRLIEPAGSGVGSQLPATKQGACGWGWGPTPALADQVILAGGVGDKGLYSARASGGDRVKLLEYEGTLFELRWHPDGTSIFFVQSEGTSGTSLSRYDFATKKVSRVKAFADRTVRGMSISPDGEWVVVEFGKTLEESVLSLVVTQKTIPELWVMRLDGTGLRLLVKNGQSPSWGLPRSN